MANNKLQPELVMGNKAVEMDVSKTGISEENLKALMAMFAEITRTSDPVVTKIREYELEKLERAKRLEEERDKREMQSRKETALLLEQKRKSDEAYQALCSHKKDRNAGSAISGQRGHSGRLILICQTCGKRFSHLSEVPPDAIPDMNLIGGPISGGGI